MARLDRRRVMGGLCASGFIQPLAAQERPGVIEGARKEGNVS
jgi:hypothetical protein